MAVPKKKTSKSKRNMRRSHDGVAVVNNAGCANCGAPKQPHHLCRSCGWYGKQQIISTAKEDSEPEE